MSDQVIDQIRAAYAQHHGFDVRYMEPGKSACLACDRWERDGHTGSCPWTYVGILLHEIARLGLEIDLRDSDLQEEYGE